jgi:hypothetical protein
VSLIESQTNCNRATKNCYSRLYPLRWIHLIIVLKNIASSFISQACSCIATTPVKAVTVTAFATVVSNVFTTATATITSTSLSVSVSVLPQTTFIPATFQQVSDGVGCNFLGTEIRHCTTNRNYCSCRCNWTMFTSLFS